jgi:peptide/nickel transport system permease protein
LSALWRRDVRPLLENPPLLIGGLGLVLLVAAAVLGPRFASFDPQAWRLVEFGPGGSIAVPPIPPNGQHLLGTDPMGRDLLSRLLWGAGLTLTAVGLAVVGRTVLGVGAGLLAAAFRGSILEATVLAASTATSGVPQLLLALLLVLLLRDWGLLGFVVALILVGWADLAQFTHAEALRLRNSEHVQAALALGGSTTHVYLTHVLRNLVPMLASLVALEAGSALIVLAELGFVGFFVSGGTFFVDDSGKPILPVRDRTPEWGQMLAGARGYTFANQWVAFVPAVVVAGVVVAFNFLSEGVRAASDPHGLHAVSPRVLGWLGRAGVVIVAVASVGFWQLAASSGGLAVDDARARALEIARRSEPSAQLVAQVVRFSSEAHALARPEQLNFYYATPRGTLRVGFTDAAETGLDVRWFEDQDNLQVNRLNPLELPGATWQDALTEAERISGTRFRNRNSGYLVSVVLVQTSTGPRYLVRYSTLGSPQPTLIIPVTGDGQAEQSAPAFLEDSAARARGLLGAGAKLWLAGALGQQSSGATAVDTWMFCYGDGTGRFLLVNYEVRETGLVATTYFLNAPTLRGPIVVPDSVVAVVDAGGLDEAIAKLGQHAVGESNEKSLFFASALYQSGDGGRQLLGVYQIAGGRRAFTLDLASGAVVEVAP